jgi:hypothetical protein
MDTPLHLYNGFYLISTPATTTTPWYYMPTIKAFALFQKFLVTESII